MMLRPSMYQIISKNESYYSLVIGVAKRAREISEQHVKEKEAAKAAAERRAKTTVYSPSMSERRIRRSALMTRRSKWSCWRKIRSRLPWMSSQQASSSS